MMSQLNFASRSGLGRMAGWVLFLAGAAVAIPVEVNHPVVGFLRRLEEKGAIAPGFWSTLPRDHREVSSVLRSARDGSVPLSDWDRRRLNRYLAEFGPEREPTRLRYRDSLLSIQGRVEYYTSVYGRDSLPSGSTNAFGSLTLGVDGAYGETMDFTAAATVGSERSTDEGRFSPHYTPHLGLPYNANRKPPHDKSTFDGFRTVLGFGGSRLRIEAGQDWNQWGPGHWQHATLGPEGYFWVQDSLAPSSTGSPVGYPGNAQEFQTFRRGYRYRGEAAPLPQVRFRIGGARWEYVKIVAQRKSLNKDSSAALVAHRLQIKLGNFTFGGTEMLSIGTRRLDGLLFLPGIPLKIAEHDGGDRDNSALSGDVEWTIKGHGRIYAEFMLDDFSGLPLDYWGNKFSWVVGGSLQDPLGLPSELHVEYARVDPWVYGHHLNSTALQSYGSLLGSRLPPNSHALSASATFPMPGNFEGLLEWHLRQRDYKTAGGSLFDDRPAENTPAAKKNFLAQDVETRNEFMLSAEWRWRRHVQLRSGIGGLWVSTWHGKPGEDLVSPQGFGEVLLHY